MNKSDKIKEGQTQIGDEHNYRPLPEPMVKETHNKALRLITDFHLEKHIDDMTRKKLSQTPESATGLDASVLFFFYVL